jgi:hypothetical protein
MKGFNRVEGPERFNIRLLDPIVGVVQCPEAQKVRGATLEEGLELTPLGDIEKAKDLWINPDEAAPVLLESRTKRRPLAAVCGRRFVFSGNLWDWCSALRAKLAAC